MLRPAFDPECYGVHQLARVVGALARRAGGLLVLTQEEIESAPEVDYRLLNDRPFDDVAIEVRHD